MIAKILNKARFKLQLLSNAVNTCTSVTHVNRWANINNFPDAWNERVDVMGRVLNEYFNTNITLLDVGCGRMYLKSVLSQNTSYTGLDVVERGGGAIVADLNDFSEWEKLGEYDVIFCSGSLEYLNDLEGFFRGVSGQCKYLFFSFSILGEQSMLERRRMGWRSHYSRDEVKVLLRESGYEIEEVRDFKSQILVLCKSGEGLS